MANKKTDSRVKTELQIARKRWGRLNRSSTDVLKKLSQEYGLSVGTGDLLLLNSGWYVTHSGLLALSRRNRCAGIRVQLVREFCDSPSGRWAFKATVYRTRKSEGFVGYGDANPSNVSPQVRGAEMRVAETRAVNRALAVST